MQLSISLHAPEKPLFDTKIPSTNLVSKSSLVKEAIPEIRKMNPLTSWDFGFFSSRYQLPEIRSESSVWATLYGPNSRFSTWAGAHPGESILSFHNP